MLVDKLVDPRRGSAGLARESVSFAVRNERKVTGFESPWFRPFRLEGRVTLDVSFKNYRQAEMLAYLPIVERTDSHSIRFVGEDMIAISKFVQFMDGYETGLAP